MRKPNHLLLAAWALAVVACAATAGSVAAEETKLDPSHALPHSERVEKAKAVADWVNAMPNGYFNADQMIQEVGSTSFHASSDVAGLGVFAKAELDEGELLAKIPLDAVINNVGEGGQRFHGDIPCVATYKLIEEFNSQEESKLAPFIDFLKATPMPQLPSLFSDLAHDLMGAIQLGTTRFVVLPPVELYHWITTDWMEGCGGGTSYTEVLAAMHMVSRADFDALVPIYDLYNHHDGAGTNVKAKLKKGVGYELYATKDISPGDQLFISYVDCPSCSREDEYGTPDLFRDFGFIEEYPQRWSFRDSDFDIESLVFDIELDSDDEVEDGESPYKVIWIDGGDDEEAHMTMKKHLSRLVRMRMDELASGPAAWSAARREDTIIPQHEWDSLVAFVDAGIVAMSNAVKEISTRMPPEHDGFDDETMLGCIRGSSDTCGLEVMYPELQNEEDVQRPRFITCPNSITLDFSKYEKMININTEYQRISFFQDFSTATSAEKAGHVKTEQLGDYNMCMDLDGIVQICDNYRPHYHEYAVNYAARYLKDIKRVAFIGGGDSMILQEVLKYPNLELVMGLELDQVVVRNSFRYFHTSPNFDDERVEWWFGDATKSLVLLPKEYANSFDYVMVDVSETATSLTVTDHIDILDAMALLVKPDGIMVKNEPYFTQMSKVFDYAIDAFYYHCPMICDQSMILGSNHIDFFRQDDLTDHKVENLLLPDVGEYPGGPYYLWRDYKNSDPNLDGSCAKLNMAIEDSLKKADRPRSGKSEGMLMVIEAENCTLPMEDVEQAITTTLKELEFTSIYSENNSGDVFQITVAMAEGYVMARRWPEHNYVAMDIYLWGRFERMETTRAALVKALGSGKMVGHKSSASSFRVVVSGMYGSHSWEEDSELIGPDLRNHTRKCDGKTFEFDEETTTATKGSGSDVSIDDDKVDEAVSSRKLQSVEEIVEDPEIIATALHTMVNELAFKNTTAIVFCGVDECPAATILESNDHIGKVIKVYTCAGLETYEFDDENMDDHETLMEIHECRKKLADEIKANQEEEIIIDAAVLDWTAPYAMARIFTSFWTFRRNIFQDYSVQLLATIDVDGKEWRRNAIQDLRRKIDLDLLTRTELLIQPKATTTRRTDPGVQFNILSLDILHEEAFDGVRAMERAVLETGTDLIVYPSVIQGGTLEYKSDYSPVKFSQADYNLEAAKQQQIEQRAFGRHSIFQFGRSGGDDSPNMETMLLSILERFRMNVIATSVHNEFGDGSMVIARCEDSDFVAVWDGRDHVTLSVFRMDERRMMADKMMHSFLANLGENWGKQLRDDMPRGIGKVITFTNEFQ